MKASRLTAQPVAEGILYNGSFEVILWRDYRWNSGQISRKWFVDPANLDEAKIIIRPLGAASGELKDS